MQFTEPTAYPAGAALFATEVNAEKARAWVALNLLQSIGEQFAEYLFGNGVALYANNLEVTAIDGNTVFQVDTGLALVHGQPVELTEVLTQGVAGDGTNHVYLHQDGTMLVSILGCPSDAIELASATVGGGVIEEPITQADPNWEMAADAFLECVGPFRNGVSRNGTAAFNGGCWE